MPHPSAAQEITGLHIDLTLSTEDDDPPLLGWLDIMLARAAELAGVCRGQLGLAIVADAEMADLHQNYKSVSGTTDVLTFDLCETPTPGHVEGDIVLCLDEARRQAAARDHTVRQEMLLYAIHGLLHLLGEDDLDEEAYQRMHAREDELLRALGVGPVFSRETRPD